MRAHRTSRTRRRLAPLILLAALLAGTAAAQDEPGEETPLLAMGNAALVLPPRATAPPPDAPPLSRVPFVVAPDGPKFALAPIAAALGVELRIGPLGEDHTLIFGDEKVIVGPDKALMLTVSGEGDEPEEMTFLAQKPFKDAQGLKVPLEFLDLTFGARLNYQFEWRPQETELVVSRRELRQLTASINLVRQHGVSTVEVRFSKPPRYRIERLPGALEIRLVGDRLRFSAERPPPPDLLVPAIVARSDRVRIELAENATAAEPRLLLTAGASLVVEVYRQTAERPPREAVRRPRGDSSPAGIHTIVLDPGHGGGETGAVAASGVTEAQLTLQVGRTLRRQLERRLPVRVVLTRSEDVELPLDSRTAIANQLKADLFISLHFNSAFGRYAHGAETFFLSREASDQLAEEVAAAENRSNGGQGDPELGLQLILWDLAQSYHLAESQRFANLVQEELNLAMGLRDRGVKQAPFRVLMGAMMPAVLVELGFLSNPEEEAKLQSPAYLSELVDALVRAVIRFKNQVEARDASLGGGPDATDGPDADRAEPAAAPSAEGAPGPGAPRR
jgi:N-acetylmuramoyl-L-alanine amidase